MKKLRPRKENCPRRGLLKSMNTRRQQSLGAILEAACHCHIVSAKTGVYTQKSNSRDRAPNLKTIWPFCLARWWLNPYCVHSPVLGTGSTEVKLIPCPSSFIILYQDFQLIGHQLGGRTLCQRAGAQGQAPGRDKRLETLIEKWYNVGGMRRDENCWQCSCSEILLGPLDHQSGQVA